MKLYLRVIYTAGEVTVEPHGSVHMDMFERTLCVNAPYHDDWLHCQRFALDQRSESVHHRPDGLEVRFADRARLDEFVDCLAKARLEAEGYPPMWP